MWRRHLLLLIALTVLQSQGLIHSPPRMINQPPADDLLYQVAQQVHEDDEPFAIECEAEGNPVPTYRWTKNDEKFEWQTYDNRISQQFRRGTLVFTSPRDEDAGQYQCFAENEYGIATSNLVFVSKAELNAFKDASPKTVVANEGEPFRLECQPPGGWPKRNVQWMIQGIDGSIRSINNSRITLDPEGNLWFSNVTRDDASDDFYYVCVVTAPFQNEYKFRDRVLLNVVQTCNSPIQIRHVLVRQYVSNRNEEGLLGKKVELYCIYGGTPLPQVIWTKDGESIKCSDRIMLDNYGKSLIIRNTTKDDVGAYTCEASNGVGKAEYYTIRLSILAIPFFTIEPEIQLAAEDEDVEFKCEADGHPKPEIKWIYNGKPISEAPPNPRRTVHKNSIVIRKVIANDTGNYGCNAINLLGYVYKDVYLNVLNSPPEIVEPPRSELTVDHLPVTLRCRVSGLPKPHVKWFHNGLELTGGRFQVQVNGDLLIDDVGATDTGKYTCHAENRFGSVKASSELILKDRTQFTEMPTDFEATAGQPATLHCNARVDSNLTLALKWLRNDEEIDFEIEPRFVLSNDHSLTISKTNKVDSGTYVCVAQTEVDEIRANATLIVQDVPRKPQLTGIRCRERDAVISWRLLGSRWAPILHYTIEYSTSYTPDRWDMAIDNVPPNEWGSNFPMRPWASYTFRVIAVNKIGPSLPSTHSESCAIQPDVPFKNPDDVKSKEFRPEYLIISWTPMPQIEHNGPDFQYRVYWKKDIPAEKWKVEDVTDWTKDYIVIDYQPTFTRYRIKVAAINRLGEANVAPREVIGYSGEDRPTEAPTNFTVLQIINGTTALLSWNPVPIKSVRGHFKGYKIKIMSEVHGETYYRKVHISDNTTRALVDVFIPGTINYAHVLVHNSRFNGPSSKIIHIKMPDCPNSVQSLEALPLGSSAFRLTWRKPLQTSGHLTGYRIYYEEIVGTNVQSKLERKPQINDPEATSAKLVGLKPDTKYRIHIVATTKAGNGDDYFIEQRTRSTHTAKPDIPHFTLKHSPLKNGLASIEIIWVPSLEGNPGSHFYTKYRIKGQTTWIKHDDVKEEDFDIITDLEPNETYEFVVVSVDGEFNTESQIHEIVTRGEGLEEFVSNDLSNDLSNEFFFNTVFRKTCVDFV